MKEVNNKAKKIEVYSKTLKFEVINDWEDSYHSESTLRNIIGVMKKGDVI